MCPSSWKLYVDDFPFFGSSLAHLEPKLQLFEVDDHCDAGWWNSARTIYVNVASANLGFQTLTLRGRPV